MSKTMTGEVTRAVRLYAGSTAHWMILHKQANLSFELEDLLKAAIACLNEIHKLDQAWQLRMLDDQAVCETSDEHGIRALYALWDYASRPVMGWVKEHEKLGYAIDHAAEFQKCCEDVKGILTPDAEFFGKSYEALQEGSAGELLCGRDSRFGWAAWPNAIERPATFGRCTRIFLKRSGQSPFESTSVFARTPMTRH